VKPRPRSERLRPASPSRTRPRLSPTVWTPTAPCCGRVPEGEFSSAPGKTPAQVAAIAQRLLAEGAPPLCHAVRCAAFEAVRAVCPARPFHRRRAHHRSATASQASCRPASPHRLCGGRAPPTSRSPRRPAVTPKVLGNRVEKLYDVGVAGHPPAFSSRADHVFEGQRADPWSRDEGALGERRRRPHHAGRHRLCLTSIRYGAASAASPLSWPCSTVAPPALCVSEHWTTLRRRLHRLAHQPHQPPRFAQEEEHAVSNRQEVMAGVRQDASRRGRPQQRPSRCGPSWTPWLAAGWSAIEITFSVPRPPRSFANA